MLSTILLAILTATGIITAGLVLLTIAGAAGVWFPLLFIPALLLAVVAPLRG